MAGHVLAGSAEVFGASVMAATAPVSAIGAAASPPAGPKPAALEASPEFAFRDLYVFPSPAKGKDPTIRAQVGLAESLDIRIYNVAGELVHQTSLSRPQVLDDGNGKGYQYTYDYTWNVGGAGSGVYICRIIARKAGEKEIRKTCRFGVVRG